MAFDDFFCQKNKINLGSQSLFWGKIGQASSWECTNYFNMQRIISLHLKISMIGFFFSNLRDDNATANDDINDAVARVAGESGFGYPSRLIRRTLGQQTNDDEQRQAHDLQTDRYMT